MYNIMLDLECLDSKRSAILVSLGAVYFDFEEGIGLPFYVELSKKSFEDQLSRGRTFSFDTYEWWMQQSDEARNVFIRNGHEKVSVERALALFSAFCQESTGKVRVWGNGVDYDNVVLRDIYDMYNIKAPWHYGSSRCYRTVKNMFGNRARLKREGTHHNGLHDAITQAEHLTALMKGLKVNE